MTQSEGFPATIHQDTKFVNDNAWAVGNWVWAAWDCLGESGIGKTPMAPEGAAAGIGDQGVMPGVYTPGDSVRLLVNGAEIPGGAPRAPERAMATFTVRYEPAEPTAVAGRNGKEIGRETLRTVGAPVALWLVPDVRRLTTSRDDLAHVLVEVLDSHGRLVPDAALEVTFEVDGAGELAAVGNGNPHSVAIRQPRH
ncbi:DUF4982 domain-containing protein [Streptomyces sp. NPDC001795]|uniref:DUF4982 domain-containing protein n=1 Tax=Streptomyces sp. NPDC001795 TaxID=3154525 RepID=UPI00333069DA